MTGPTKRVVAALRASQETQGRGLTLKELAAQLQYPIDAVLRALLDARIAGVRVRSIRDESIANVPARSQPEPDALTTTYVVAK